MRSRLSAITRLRGNRSYRFAAVPQIFPTWRTAMEFWSGFGAGALCGATLLLVVLVIVATVGFGAMA